MLIFLYGPDSYRRQKKIEEIVAAYIEKNSDSSVSSFDLEEDEPERLNDFLKNRSLFEEKKLAVVKNLSAEVSLKEILSGCIGSETISIVVSAGGNIPEYEFLTKPPVLFQEFSELNRTQAALFVKNEFLKNGIVASESAAAELVRIFGADTWGLTREIEKLSLLEKNKIEIEEVSASNDFYESPNFFAFINAVKFKRNPFPHLEKLFSSGEDAAKIFNILASQLQGDAVALAADCDIAVKSGKMDYEEALLFLSLKNQEK